MERKDNWYLQDDILLAEVVLSHLKNASTQLKAFREAAERLGRTAACGFRWNSSVRKRYEDNLSELKVSKKFKSKPKASLLPSTPVEDGLKKSLTEIFTYIKELELVVTQQKIEIEQLNKQLKHAHDRNIANEDLQMLLKIISQARQNGYLNQAN